MKLEKLKNRKTQRKNELRNKSINQEQSVAKSIGGRVTLASGALSFDKADVVRKDLKLRIECKRTDKESIILKKSWLKKLIGNAKNEIPMLNIEIQDENWYLIRKEEVGFILEKLIGEVK